MNFPTEVSPSTQLLLDELRKLSDKQSELFADLTATIMRVSVPSSASISPAPAPSAAISPMPTASVVADNWGELFEGGDDSSEQHCAMQSVVADNWGGLFDPGHNPENTSTDEYAQLEAGQKLVIPLPHGSESSCLGSVLESDIACPEGTEYASTDPEAPGRVTPSPRTAAPSAPPVSSAATTGTPHTISLGVVEQGVGPIVRVPAELALCSPDGTCDAELQRAEEMYPLPQLRALQADLDARHDIYELVFVCVDMQPLTEARAHPDSVLDTLRQVITNPGVSFIRAGSTHNDHIQEEHYMVLFVEQEAISSTLHNRCLMNCLTIIPCCFPLRFSYIWDAVICWQHRPWPPPSESHLVSCEAELRPLPWPSFDGVERYSVTSFSGHLWKPPWYVSTQKHISPVVPVELWKCLMIPGRMVVTPILHGEYLLDSEVKVMTVSILSMTELVHYGCCTDSGVSSVHILVHHSIAYHPWHSNHMLLCWISTATKTSLEMSEHLAPVGIVCNPCYVDMADFDKPEDEKPEKLEAHVVVVPWEYMRISVLVVVVMSNLLGLRPIAWPSFGNSAFEYGFSNATNRLLFASELLEPRISWGGFLHYSAIAQLELRMLHCISCCIPCGLVHHIRLLHLLLPWTSNFFLVLLSGSATGASLLLVCYARRVTKNLLLPENKVVEVTLVDTKVWFDYNLSPVLSSFRNCHATPGASGLNYLELEVCLASCCFTHCVPMVFLPVTWPAQLLALLTCWDPGAAKKYLDINLDIAGHMASVYAVDSTCFVGVASIKMAGILCEAIQTVTLQHHGDGMLASHILCTWSANDMISVILLDKQLADHGCVCVPCFEAYCGVLYPSFSDQSFVAQVDLFSLVPWDPGGRQLLLSVNTTDCELIPEQVQRKCGGNCQYFSPEGGQLKDISPMHLKTSLSIVLCYHLHLSVFVHATDGSDGVRLPNAMNATEIPVENDPPMDTLFGAQSLCWLQMTEGHRTLSNVQKTLHGSALMLARSILCGALLVAQSVSLVFWWELMLQCNVDCLSSTFSVPEFLKFPWDPGISILLHRLGGKPSLKERGMSAYSCGWAVLGRPMSHGPGLVLGSDLLRHYKGKRARSERESINQTITTKTIRVLLRHICPSREEADKVVNAFHNKHTLSG